MNNDYSPYTFRREYEPGARNQISDVKGIKVGHVTINDGETQTGVTVMIPGENIFKNKLPAAMHVINGYGKSAGLVQVEELGSIESYIAFTNTLALGTVWQGMRNILVEENEELKSVNPMIFECNDSVLNDIRKNVITQDMVKEAYESASEDFEEGAVGAGRGMLCHDLKGGIGSASRKTGEYTIGAFVLTNHGIRQDLTLFDTFLDLGTGIKEEDQGSCCIVIATDAPLSDRQLKRVCHRATIGLAKTGANMGHGSGEVVLAFTTSTDSPSINEDDMNDYFRPAIEAVHEAVVSSMWNAETTVGFQNTKILSIQEVLAKKDC